MSYIDTEKIKKYSPDNNEFLATALRLLFDEIEKFEKSILKFKDNNDFSAFKQAIHKIKPSVDLFQFPHELKNHLLDFYDTKTENLSLDNKNNSLNYFESEITLIKQEISSEIIKHDNLKNAM